MVKYKGFLRRLKIYAVIESGGKQYRVSPGATIQVDRLQVKEGDKITLDRVLLLGDEDKVTVGKPTVAGATVTATVAKEVKGKKIIVYRYKAKVGYDKKTGHRQDYTRLVIDGITLPGAEVAKTPRPRKRGVPKKEGSDKDGA